MTRLAYSAAEVAELLGVSDDTIRALVRGGSLPAVRVGRLLRIPAAAVERLVYTADDASTESERRGHGLQSQRQAPATMGGGRRRRLAARRQADPTRPLRSLPAGGAGDAR
jgi:excisionase family DNA binding protein